MDEDREISAYFSDIYKWIRMDRKFKVFHVRGVLDMLIAALMDKLY